MTNQIKLTFTPGSSFLLGGVTINPAYDSATALEKYYFNEKEDKEKEKEKKEREGLPYLTATAIKGALRMDFEAFVRGIGEEELCDFDSDIRGCSKCLACRLFGGGNEEGKLRFNAARIEMPENVLPKNTRHNLLAKGRREGVSISRTLGKSKDGAYFTKLAFPKIKEIEFITSIDIRRELNDKEKEYLDMFFKYLDHSGIFMGSRKSVGLGYFKIKSEIPGKFQKPVKVVPSGKEPKLFRITLETKEPLLVGGTKNKYITDTLPYIPASTLGGTIGFRLSEYGIDNQILETMFNEAKTFSTFNCYLESAYPVPLSQRSPKGKKEEKENIKDILIPDYIIKLAIDQDKFDNDKVKPLFELLYKTNLRPVPFCKKPETFYNAKVAIGRELQKAGESLLYSMELIPAGSTFQGFIIGEPWAVETLEKIGEWCMGGKRTRGFGRTKLAKKEEVPVDELVNVNTGNPVDSLLREMAGKFHVVLPEDRNFFALDLVSDFALPGEIPKEERSFKRFIEERFFEGLGVIVEKSFLEITRRGGYDFREKKAKPMIERIGSGSVLLVSVPIDNEERFKEKIKGMINESVQYKWDSTPLFRLDSSEHTKIWRLENE